MSTSTAGRAAGEPRAAFVLARLLRRRGWRRIARLAAIAAIEEFRANWGRVGGPWAGTIRESYGGHRPRRHPRGLTLAGSTRTGPAAVISGLSRIGRFRCTGMTGGPAKIIAGANDCMNLCRTRGLPALAAATFRMGLIMERGLMGGGSALALTTPARGAGMDAAMTPGMALEDVWI